MIRAGPGKAGKVPLDNNTVRVSQTEQSKIVLITWYTFWRDGRVRVCVYECVRQRRRDNEGYEMR